MTFTADVPVYDLAQYKKQGKISVPAKDRTTILNSFERVGITEPSESQIIDAYITLKKQ